MSGCGSAVCMHITFEHTHTHTHNLLTAFNLGLSSRPVPEVTWSDALKFSAPLKLRPCGAIQICLLLLFEQCPFSTRWTQHWTMRRSHLPRRPFRERAETCIPSQSWLANEAPPAAATAWKSAPAITETARWWLVVAEDWAVRCRDWQCWMTPRVPAAWTPLEMLPAKLFQVSMRRIVSVKSLG